MSIEIKAPVFPESVAEGTIATWHKQPGEACSRDELIVDIETDKVVLEVVAPADGAIEEVMKAEGDTVESGEVIGKFKKGAGGESGSSEKDSGGSEDKASSDEKEPAGSSDDSASKASGEAILSPAARKLAEENDIEPETIKGTGKDGRVTKEDVQNHIDNAESSSSSSGAQAPAADMPEVDLQQGERPEKRVPMTRLRASIAKRLVNAQQTAAMLTTFNEVNMGPVMELRKQYKENFEKRHGIKLGFMSFFVKACCHALREVPDVNAEIDGDHVVYKDYVHMGVAVGTPNGLVVPVLRDAHLKSFAAIEQEIAELGTKARDGKLGMADMQGGSFTISNGGVYGSLMSSPILNPPQSGILGMHKIQERPMAVKGQVEIRPMMYLALSYDHRIVDGREAVTFLVRVKECLEDPARMLLQM